MHRLANFDVPAHFRTSALSLTSQLLFGTACAIVQIAIRVTLDLVAPGVGPFALIYPAVLIATLFGHWQAGLVAFALTFIWAWSMVLHPMMSFRLESADQLRVALNAVSALLVLILAEVFRRAVRLTAAERDRQIESSEMLRLELEHRTKNNFQLISSLLHLQQRREIDETVKRALALTARRVASFTAAYAHLGIAPSAVETVPMRPYLTKLVEEVANAVFDYHVTVSSDIAELDLDRSKAMAIGLYTNEALTNCAKHAFAQGQPGRVDVVFAVEAGGWVLNIRDDGRGKDPELKGTGSVLMEALAKQAGAVHRTSFPDAGCVVRLCSER